MESSADREGFKQRTCQICGENETEIIERLPQNNQQEGNQAVDDQSTEEQVTDNHRNDDQSTEEQITDNHQNDDQKSADSPEEESGGKSSDKGVSAEASDKAIKSLKSDNDPKGAVFAPLMLKSKKQTNTSIKLSWKKHKKAKKYVIYGNKSGKSNKPKKLATVKGNSKTIKKVAGKKLKKGTYYKFIVVALDSNNNVISTSKIVHVATKGKGNYTKITTKAKNNKVSMKRGKTFKLSAKAVGKNVRKYVGLRYESSDPKVAKVSKSGKITAKKKGTCKVYVYAQNGVCKSIKVTVK